MDDRDEEWEEEKAYLGGEINSVNTTIDSEENHEELARQSAAGEADSPAGPVHKAIEDSYMEFSGELGPGQAFSSGMAPGLGGWASDGENGSRVPAADAPSGEGKGRTTAWIAIILAIGSLFIWPAVLGPAAIVMGVVSFAGGNKAVGIWSVALGLLAVFAYFVLLPRIY